MKKNKPIKESARKREYNLEDFGQVIAVDKDGNPIVAIKNNEKSIYQKKFV